MRRLLLLLALAVPVTASATQAVAPRYSQQVEREARRLFGEILSPYCPGLVLTACPSDGASVLKDLIRVELASGRTPSEVMRGLETRFGTGIRARPAASSFGALVWVVPFLVIGAAGVGVAWWLRSGARSDRRPS